MGKIISNVGRAVGKLLGVNTDPPPLPPIPEPVPTVPREPINVNDAVSTKTKERVRGRRNRSGTMRTGPRGVTKDTEITYQSLLANPDD